MKDEPLLDRSELMAHIRREYALDIVTLTFLPNGFASHCYIALAADGLRYFVKICALTPIGLRFAEQLDVWLPLLWAMHQQQLFSRVPLPVTTVRGAFKSYFDGMAFAVMHFIEGELLGFSTRPSDDLLAQIARAMGSIHQSTGKLDISAVSVEQFAIPFEADLQQALVVLETITARDSWGKQALRDLLLSRRAELQGQLDRLHELQQWARAHPTPLVLCHTDMHGNNLILDQQGAIHVIDWETPLLAPPEQDMFFHARDRFDFFLDHYEQVRGPVQLDSLRFGFYFYRRNLEDMTFLIMEILYENPDDVQTRINLAGLEKESITGWRNFESNIEKVEQVLQRRKELADGS